MLAKVSWKGWVVNAILGFVGHIVSTSAAAANS